MTYEDVFALAVEVAEQYLPEAKVKDRNDFLTELLSELEHEGVIQLTEEEPELQDEDDY